ncbi:hypothetical protein ADUPG1_004202, partial [Aduncisulcus paluster]
KEVYMLEEVRSHTRNERGRFKEKDRYAFEAKWLGYEETTMEPWTNLDGSGPFIEYCKNNPKLKKIFNDSDTTTKTTKTKRGRRKKKDWQRESSSDDSDDSDLYKG